MSSMKKIAVVFSRLGPYHVARLDGAARVAARNGAELVGIEVAGTDAVNLWTSRPGPASFRHRCLFPDASYQELRGSVIRSAVVSALTEEGPGAVALPGWHRADATGGLAWCRRTGTRAILMSESSRHDTARQWWREWFKRRVVGRYDSALVGGRSHAAYAAELGMPREHIFLGYDVVDNRHFAEGASRAREQSDVLRGRYGLPAQYFLGVGRFVAKKNFAGLLDAFASYRDRAGAGAWHLALCGEGPLRSDLEEQSRALSIQDRVIFAGVVQYDELPAFYGLAGAFVHASTTEQWGLVVNEAMASGLPVLVSDRCGCAGELVQEGVNGYKFGPVHTDRLASLLFDVSGGGGKAAQMGQASQRLIADWTPERFGSSLWDAATVE